MHIAKCAMRYIILVTAFTNFLLHATTGLQRGVLSQILLSFTLIFHFRAIGGNRGILNLKNLCCYFTFQFSLLCVYIQNQQKLCL